MGGRSCAWCTATTGASCSPPASPPSRCPPAPRAADAAHAARRMRRDGCGATDAARRMRRDGCGADAARRLRRESESLGGAEADARLLTLTRPRDQGPSPARALPTQAPHKCYPEKLYERIGPCLPRPSCRPAQCGSRARSSEAEGGGGGGWRWSRGERGCTRGEGEGRGARGGRVAAGESRGAAAAKRWRDASVMKETAFPFPVAAKRWRDARSETDMGAWALHSRHFTCKALPDMGASLAGLHSLS